MTFFFLFFGYLGVPVAFSLLGGVMIGAISTDVSHTALIQKMFDGMDSEALLAIPFFLLVGELMSSANVVQRVANLSLSLVGHIRGGLSQVVTVFSMFFSEMSGSTTADVAVMSRALGGPMKREGYEGPFIAGFAPGLMIGVGLMTYCYFFGPAGFRRRRATLGAIGTAAYEAALPLMI